MHIHSVVTKKDLREFINLPFKIYKNDPIWVPPLKSEIFNQFDPAKKPVFGSLPIQIIPIKRKQEGGWQDCCLHRYPRQSILE